jgi:ATP-dependent protease ClpP protease subunit
LTKLKNQLKTINLSGKPIVTNKRKFQQDDEDMFQENENFLSFCAKTYSTTELSVPIDTEFKDASYYRHVVQAITSLDEGDQVEFVISSPGGNYNGLVALLGALDRTPATSVAVISGICHSAASMLALNCDAIAVSNYAEMLIHYVSFGAGGKGADVKSQVDHTCKVTEKLFRDTYKYFLTEEEIEDCLRGVEYWLDADQILERLKIRQELQQKEAEETSDEDSCEENCAECSCGYYEEED